jgi:hypothetical protein
MDPRLDPEKLCQYQNEMQQSELVKDRRYHLRLYPRCFVGSEAVQWLMERYHMSHEDALRVGKAMLDLGLFHHVVKQHHFEDGYFFYRFEVRVFM